MSRGWAHAIAAVCMLMINLSASSSCTYYAEEEDSFSLVQVEHYIPQRPAETLLGTESASISNDANHDEAHLGTPSTNITIGAKPTLTDHATESTQNGVFAIDDKSAPQAVYFLFANLHRAQGLKPDAGGQLQEQKAPAVNWTCPVRAERAPVAKGRTDCKPASVTHSITHQLLDKIGIYRCLSGLGKTIKPPREHSLKANAGDPSTHEAQPAPPVVRSPATVNLKDGHPSFAGTWNCIAVEGDPEGLMSDLEVGYYSVLAAKAAGWGAGKLTREYTHEGPYLKFKEFGVMTREQEWNINGKEQKTPNDVLVKPYWDSELPHILVAESMDMEKEKPSTWSTTRQYFINEDTLIHDVSSQSGNMATWVWQRSEAGSPEVGSSELSANDAKLNSETLPSPRENASSDFDKMVEAVKTATFSASNDEKLEVYSLFKQAKEGDVKTERPGMLDFTGRAKWDAWKTKEGWDAERATKVYIKEVGSQFNKYGQALPDGLDYDKYKDCS